MKIIQLTDCHFLAPGETYHGLDPAARFAACVASINEEHADADLVVATGDLADKGREEAYLEFRNEISRLKAPWRLIPGNHDRRDAMRRVFTNLTADENGFIQSVEDFPEGRLIFLDTLDEGNRSGSGRLCEKRRAWLAARLDEAADRPVYLFMHHPLLSVGVRHFEYMRLLEPGPVVDLLVSHGNVRHITIGHVHLNVSGSWRGIPFSANRGTCHHIVLDLPARDVHFSAAAPSYAVLQIDEDGVNVHHHEFLALPPGSFGAMKNLVLSTAD